MILSDRDLRKRLKTVAELGLPDDLLARVARREPPKELEEALAATPGTIVINEIPPDEWFDADTMDLAFGNVIEASDMPFELVRVNDRPVIRRFTIDLRYSGESKRLERVRPVDIVDDSRKRIVLKDEEAFELQPGMLVLAHTKQFVCVPYDLQMQIGGRSKIARSGVSVHVSSPVFHPGWCGHPTLEVKNDGLFAFNLYPGLQFAPVHFIQLSSPAERPYLKKPGAQFSGQR